MLFIFFSTVRHLRTGNLFGNDGAMHLAEELYSSIGHSHSHHHHGHGHDHEHSKNAVVSAHYGNESDDELDEEQLRQKYARLPLIKFELACCGITGEGIQLLLKALAHKATLRILDLSDNDLSGAKETDALTMCLLELHLKELYLNRCKLGTIGASKIMRLYAGLYHVMDGSIVNDGVCSDMRQESLVTEHSITTTGTVDGFNKDPLKMMGFGGIMNAVDGLDGNESIRVEEERHMIESGSAADVIRVLGLSGNHIHNAIGRDLASLMRHNSTLALLDLGFNSITDTIKKKVNSSLVVVSTSSDAKKLSSLHINLQGNECDQSLFETPGLARSKTTFEFARSTAVGDYSHVPSQDISVYKKRLQNSLMAYREDPVRTQNFIS